MTAQSIVCGSCAAEVPYGRLSCPSCGELLASVAGSRRSAAAAASSATATTLPSVLYDPDDAPVVDVDGAIERRPIDDGIEDDDGLSGLLSDDEDDGDESLEGGSTTGGPAWAIAGASLTGPVTPAYMPRPNRARAAAVNPSAAANPSPAAPDMAAPAVNTPPVGALAPDLPGAYVPPLPAAAVVPAGPVAPARAWAGHTNGTDPGHPSADAAAGGSSLRPAVDASRLAEFVGSVSVAGAALASVGFLLPWASVVIGSTGSGYFDRWGLAGPGHLVVVLGTLAILALAVVRNPVPTWIRTGVAGLGVGALLLGLAWPYVLDPALEAAPGVLIESVGALALIVAGVLALATDRPGRAGRPAIDRHAEPPEAV